MTVDHKEANTARFARNCINTAVVFNVSVAVVSQQALTPSNRKVWKKNRRLLIRTLCLQSLAGCVGPHLTDKPSSLSGS